MTVEYHNAQINLYSDIQLSSLSTQFQPANIIELLSSSIVTTLTECGQLCNENVQCHTFDYDLYSRICRLFEGTVGTGQIISSTSQTSCVGSVRLQSNFFTAFGQPCIQCTNNRYLICSSDTNNTCQCPKNTFWNGTQCVNQGYENANCVNNQWCRQDAGVNCTQLHFCTEYHCGNMTIIKSDLPGNDLVQQRTSDFSTCCSWCQSYSGCMAYTWISAPGTFFGMCYLKFSMGTPSGVSSYHISAYYNNN